LGGGCLADLGVLRAQSQLFGRVAPDPTVSRLIDILAGDVEAALVGIRGLGRRRGRRRGHTAARSGRMG